jgi:hypothetical protein
MIEDSELSFGTELLFGGLLIGATYVVELAASFWNAVAIAFMFALHSGSTW